MRKDNYLFTSESVSEGHPDKICDRISDEIVDLYLEQGETVRTGVETLVTTNQVILAGEVRSPSPIDPEKMIAVAREAVRKIGYEQKNFHWREMDVKCLIHNQSSDIAIGVDASGNKDEGAGDQGLMFGYACRETPELMPAPIQYCHQILRTLAEARHTGKISGLGPDSKSQLTVCYENGKPIKCSSVVVSSQHDEDLDQNDVKEIVRPIVEDCLPDGWMCSDDEFYVNPTGRFVIGGPDSDAGLTGRKIIVDTYGGAAPHGGGAFSGKDPTKVDRSAAYGARYVAKNIVAAELAEKCIIQLAYAIGVAKPLCIYIDTLGTAAVEEEKLAGAISEVIDLSPRGIRERLKLSRPIYARTSAYGHFGRSTDEDGGFSWELTNLVDDLKAALS